MQKEVQMLCDVLNAPRWHGVRPEGVEAFSLIALFDRSGGALRPSFNFPSCRLLISFVQLSSRRLSNASIPHRVRPEAG